MKVCKCVSTLACGVQSESVKKNATAFFSLSAYVRSLVGRCSIGKPSPCSQASSFKNQLACTLPLLAGFKRQPATPAFWIATSTMNDLLAFSFPNCI